MAARPSVTKQVIIQNQPRGNLASQHLASTCPIHESSRGGPEMESPRIKQAKMIQGTVSSGCPKTDAQPVATESMAFSIVLRKRSIASGMKLLATQPSRKRWRLKYVTADKDDRGFAEPPWRRERSQLIAKSRLPISATLARGRTPR